MDFIVPLRSPKVATNWEQVSDLCNGTLRSLTRQTTEDLRVHLVCHTLPAGFTSHPLINVVPVDFPIPTDRDEMIVDKCEKIKRGLIEVGKYGAGHVMVVDADDRVHCDVAAWANAHPEVNGWYVDEGYVYPFGSHILFRRPEFHRYCGTSLIIRWQKEDIPATMDNETELFQDVILDGHHVAASNLSERDRPLEPLPFPGACYITDTTDNWSGVSMLKWKGKKAFLKQLTQLRIKTSWHREKFAL